MSRTNATRADVFARDRGVCAYRALPSDPPCGIDTEHVRVAFEAAIEWAKTCDVSDVLRPLVDKHPLASVSALHAQVRQDLLAGVRDRMKALGFSPGRVLWEADHVQPVSEGGGKTGLENRRTLCRPHHLAVTRELRARLARRPSKAFRRGNFER